MFILKYALSTLHPIIQAVRRFMPKYVFRRCQQLYLTLLQAHEMIPTDLEVRGVDIVTLTKCYGGSADIHIGRLNGIKVALKAPRMYQANKRQIMTEFINEFMIMASLGSHPHIVNFMGVSCDPDVGPAIITSWMDNGTLTDIIRLDPPHEYRRQLVEQIVEGMSFLKASNVVHGDVKSSNILISHNGRACIADFGLSRFADTSHFSPPTVISGLRIAESTLSWILRIPPSFDRNKHVGAGSPRWMAPELLLPNQCESAQASFESDIFALGMVVYEIYSGTFPYQESNDNMAMLCIVQGKRPHRPERTPDDLWFITTKCWVSDPFLRPSIDAVKRAITSSEPPFDIQAPQTRKETLKM